MAPQQDDPSQKPEAGNAPVSLDQKRQERVTAAAPQKTKVPPLLNIPTCTKWLTGLLIFIYLVQEIGMDPAQKTAVYHNLGFVPAMFHNLSDFQPLAIITPLTYMFFHGSLIHIVVNSLMLLAFGAGIEKWIGGRKMLLVFFLCGIAAALVHLLFNFSSTDPVIGASGATSGLFAAGIVMLKRMNMGVADGPYGLVPLIAVFIAISFIFSFSGSSDVQGVAWIAHIGGFLAGFGLMKLMRLL